jgi:probable phosphoglycerate mutase
MSNERALRVYLIRHGETDWSLTGRHTGRTDLALTPNGEAEARALVDLLAPIRFSQVWTSPLLRARQTCALAGLDALAQVEADLAEWDYGDYEGLRSTEIVLERPGWNVYRDGCPGGESPAQVAARAARLVARLTALEGDIALFTHGQIGSALAATWIELAIADARHFTLATASLSVLGFDPHHREVPVIALWNSITTPSAR